MTGHKTGTDDNSSTPEKVGGGSIFTSKPTTWNWKLKTLSVVLVVDEGDQYLAEEDHVVHLEQPFLKFLGHLKKWVTQKFYWSLVLEDVLTHDALLDIGGDIPVMSVQLFKNLQRASNHANKEL